MSRQGREEDNRYSKACQVVDMVAVRRSSRHNSNDTTSIRAGSARSAPRSLHVHKAKLGETRPTAIVTWHIFQSTALGS
jgi:hypothetical protein